MARHPTQLSLDEEQSQAPVDLAESQKHRSRKREALARLQSLRRDLLARIGTAARDPIAEARLAREQQSDEVLRRARER